MFIESYIPRIHETPSVNRHSSYPIVSLESSTVPVTWTPLVDGSPDLGDPGLAGGAGAREHPGVSGPSGMGQEDPICLFESGENN